MIIRRVEDHHEKSTITETILRQLPDWFGLEEYIVSYINQVKDYPFYAASLEEKAIGFIAIKSNNQYTAEIYLMGILEGYHRKGIGKKLLTKAEEELQKKEFKFLMVKTVGDSSPDPHYGRTREFYKGVGFYPLEEIKELWDESNPCLIMVKRL